MEVVFHKPLPCPVNKIMGYLAAHYYHSQQIHDWSQQAYKGILNSSLSPRPGGIVMLNLGMYEPMVDPKGHPILVHVMIFL